MRVLLLSNGPSARLFDGDQRSYDVVIAVTKAATLFPCHWWVVGDDQVFENLGNLRGEPMFVFICKDISIHKGPEYLRDARAWLKTRSYVLRWRDVPNATEKSGPAALALARHLLLQCDHEEKLVDVYGVDMAGTSDCRQDESEPHRGEGRWARERKLWEAIETLCESEGIRVRNHSPSLQAR